MRVALLALTAVVTWLVWRELREGMGEPDPRRPLM